MLYYFFAVPSPQTRAVKGRTLSFLNQSIASVVVEMALLVNYFNHIWMFDFSIHRVIRSPMPSVRRPREGVNVCLIVDVCASLDC